jgi:hypothetical protein
MNVYFTNLDTDATKATGGSSIGGLITTTLGNGLCLAAAPTFAVMALLTAVLGGGSQHMLCSDMRDALTGMIPMYLLMSVFHAAPWLKLIPGWRRPGEPRSHDR